MTDHQPPADWASTRKPGAGPARFRFTIGRLMLGVAALAPVLALARVGPNIVGYLAFLAASAGLAWGAWRACRRRPGLALLLNGICFGVGVVLVMLGRLGFATPLWFLAWTFLSAPVVVGSGERWFQTKTPLVHAGDFCCALFMRLMSIVAILLAVPTHVFLFFASLDPEYLPLIGRAIRSS